MKEELNIEELNIQESIRLGYITQRAFDRGNYATFNGYVYTPSTHRVVISRYDSGGNHERKITPILVSFHCYITNDYYCLFNFRKRTVYTLSGVKYAEYFAIERLLCHRIVEYIGSYYEIDSLSRYGLEIDDSGEVRRVDDGDDDNEDDDDDDGYVHGYHSAPSTSVVTFSDDPKVWVGFEAEKEDEDVKYSTRARSISNLNFKKERDGSLCDDAGFELISPRFEYDVQKIISYIKERPLVVKHINADVSSACGGHISVSVKDKVNTSVHDDIKYYLPLLYAMYPSRTKNNYCRATNIEEKNESAHRYAIEHHGNSRLEFRIFPAIINMANLEFRLKLVKLFLDFPARSTEHAIANVISNQKIFLENNTYSAKTFLALLQRWCSLTSRWTGVQTAVDFNIIDDAAVHIASIKGKPVTEELNPIELASF